MITVCPNDEELLAVASGDEPSAELQSHLLDCSRCLRKVSSFKFEVKELQKAFGSTEQDQMHSPEPISRVPTNSPPASQEISCLDSA